MQTCSAFLHELFRIMFVTGSPKKHLDSLQACFKKKTKKKHTHTKNETHTQTVRKLNVNYNKIYDSEIVSIGKILVCF